MVNAVPPDPALEAIPPNPVGVGNIHPQVLGQQRGGLNPCSAALPAPKAECKHCGAKIYAIETDAHRQNCPMRPRSGVSTNFMSCWKCCPWELRPLNFP